MTTPVHQGGGINHQEELPITTTTQTCLHAVVHSQVRSRSQAAAPWKTSWIRTEIHAQNSPIQQLLSCLVTVLWFTQQLTAHLPCQTEKQNPEQMSDLWWRREQNQEVGAKRCLPGDPEQSSRPKQLVSNAEEEQDLFPLLSHSSHASPQA